MKVFNINLECPLHNLVMDAYCKNPECKIEDRICCNTCVQEKHKHQTTRIWELKNVFEDAIKLLQDRDNKLLNFIDQITQKVSAIRQITNKDITYLKQMIEDFENQTLTNLITALKISYSLNNHEISERVTELVERQLNKNSLISSKSINYVKLLEENQKDVAKQVLQEIIDLDQNNHIYKQEMNRIKIQYFQNSSSENIQKNAVDINHLILQYKYFLLEDQNDEEALKILDQILEIDKDNYIYQNERSRLTHGNVDYSTADLSFFNGQYLASLIRSKNILSEKQIIHFILGLSLFYIKDYQNALSSIDKSIEFDIENIQYKITRSQLLFALKNLDQLKISAMELNKCFISINLAVEGQILILQNDYEKANECFEQAIQIDYFNYEAHYLQALCLSKIHQSQTSELCMSLQEILQKKNQKGILDMKKIQKFYHMYLEGQKNINQLQLSPRTFKKWNQMLIESGQKKATNSSALQQ